MRRTADRRDGSAALAGRLRRPGWLVLVLAVALVPAAPGAAQNVTITGVVEEERSGRPVADVVLTLVGTRISALSDPRGLFRLVDVPPGDYTLRVSHLGFGEQTVQIAVTADLEPVRVRLSERAVVLEALTVDVLSTEERRARGAGFRRSIVVREQIALAENSNMTMPDVLRQYVPQVRVRRNERLAGSDVCIELRTIRGMAPGAPCLSPAVYLDGVPVTNPTSLYATIDPNQIERMEVIPAAEAGALYGTGALYGALLIETRRPGAALDPSHMVNVPRAFDWTLDQQTHPTTRSFAFALIGNTAGLLLGLAAANECIATRRPSHDRLVTTCDTWPTFGAGAAALLLPAFGGAFGSSLGGQTTMSRGRLLPAAAGTAMALVPGYALIISSQRSDSDGLRLLGTAIITVGAPIVAALSDHLFRSLRNDDGGN